VRRCRLAWRKTKRGAESRDRARAKTFSGRDWAEVVAVIAILSLCIAGAYTLRDPNTLPIRQVRFEDALVDAARSELQAAVAHRLAGNFFTVNLRDIERTLSELGWVKSASVRRRWPSALVIDIEEQVPVARWGKDALLNRAGKIFKPHGSAFPAHLPILHGPAGRTDSLLARFQRLSKILAPARLSVRALVQDQRRAWHLLLDNGIAVAIGRGDPVARVARLARVYPQVLVSRAQHIERIDLRYTNGLAVAWKQPDDQHAPARATQR
jgi:cell division protein FtsQ